MDDRLLAFAVCLCLPPLLTCCLLNRIFDFLEPIIVAVAVSLDFAVAIAVAIAVSLDVAVAVSLDAAVAVSLAIPVAAVRDGYSLWTTS